MPYFIAIESELVKSGMSVAETRGQKKGAGGAGHRPPEEMECSGGPAPQFQKVSNFNAKFGVRPNSSISKRFFSKSIFLKIPSGRAFHKNAKQPAGIEPPSSRESPQSQREYI
jgi:hypothetical protein